MPQQVLKVFYIYSFFQQMCGKAVSQSCASNHEKWYLFEFLQLFDFYKGCGSKGETLGLELEPKNTITKTQKRFPSILAIAASIANMPSKSLLSLAYTKDLEDEWQYQRSLSRYLARGFIVVGLKLNINPFSRKHQPEMSQGDKKVCLQDAYK